ncbi:MAG: chloride channel protein [Alphaproteobacteria bacterium]
MPSKKSWVLWNINKGNPKIFRESRDILLVNTIACLIGALGGFFVYLFWQSIQFFQRFFFQTGNESLFHWGLDSSSYLLLVIPTLGGLLIGLYYKYLMPGGISKGPVDAIKAAKLQQGKIGVHGEPWATIGSALSIGVGAAVGREGPAIYFGSVIGSKIGQYLHLSAFWVRTLLGSGVAAAVSASFNAPLAAVVFTHEVVLGHYAIKSMSPIVLSSVVSAMVSRLLFVDDVHHLIASEHFNVTLSQMPFYMVLGVISAIFALGFMHSIRLTNKMWQNIRIASYFRPMFAGLVVGIIALYIPAILGIGSELTQAILLNNMPFIVAATLLFVRFLASSICLGSGFGGGIFSPSMTIGSLLGGTSALLMNSIFPSMEVSTVICALAGAAAFSSATLGAPLSTTLIVFEMTNDYKSTLATIIAAMIATILSTLLGGRSWFMMQMADRGIALNDDTHRFALEEEKIGSIIKRDPIILHKNENISVARRQMMKQNALAIFVVDDDNKSYLGTIRPQDIAEASGKDTVEKHMHTSVSPLTLNDSVETARLLFSQTDYRWLPVVGKQGDNNIIGYLRERDLVNDFVNILKRQYFEEHN